MNIVILNGNMPQNDFGLGKVIKIITDTLAELEISAEEINLGYSETPYFDGIKSQATDEIIRRLRDSAGVVVACTAQLFSPTAIMQTFFEYLQLDEYADALREKHCFLVAVSQRGGERSALDYISRVVQYFGGFESATIGLQEIHTRSLDAEYGGESAKDEIREIIERETEDFYRVLRQNRKRVIPRDYAVYDRVASLTGADVAVFSPVGEKKERVPVSEVYQKLNLDAFTEQQERDIQELTRFFAEKYASPDGDGEPVPVKAPARKIAVTPRERSARQITQSLPHYFQPQLSNGLTAVIQFNISGEETFDGYVTIQSTECAYAEGVHSAPDITIIADTAIWKDVLTHKYTAQKAFMIGGLKVRGNFVLLTKFDMLFKLE
ncbi:MAG: SCP2 sterol-binding domain-containing protein [Clostridiales bacterium]|jgi:putative sterol carrier protein/multimeric flavodoxin WrbA|nr:SCP2 sterol-binding domain-containing protein [Clostridiales bacterium]